jgi:glycosyltransferase involved in cell wall biosynthesis
LFPDKAEPYRGLDNVTILHRLKSHYDIRVICPRPTLFGSPARNPRSDTDSVFEPIYVPARYVPKLGSFFNHKLMTRALAAPIARLRAEWNFDVVLSSWIYPDSCAVASLIHDRPFVSIAQGSDVHQYLKMPARREVILSAMRRAAGIITRSAKLSHLLAEAGLDKNKLHPIYNGIDFEQFRPGDKQSVRKALNLPETAPVILFVGNFYAIKNPLLLVKAHAQIPNAHLVTIGGGPLEKEAQALAAQLGTRNRITFAGRKLANEVAKYMQAADVLALPSQNEGVPNVILEAFASGLRVVASRVGGIPEVHHSDIHGRLIPVGDISALADALRETLSTPGDTNAIRQHALQFSWERATAEYLSVLEQARQ